MRTNGDRPCGSRQMAPLLIKAMPAALGHAPNGKYEGTAAEQI